MSHPWRRDRRSSSDAYSTETHDSGVRANAAPGGALVVQIDKSVGKHFLLVIWLSAVMTALSVVGLFLVWDAYRHTRQHVNVLQYDLMDLRSKTGHAHENTE